MQNNENPVVPVTDYLVEVVHPKALDLSLRLIPQMAARVVGEPEPIVRDGYYVVRVFGDPGFFLFAMKNQGYCTVIGPCETLT